jgi:hypothetical protein
LAGALLAVALVAALAAGTRAEVTATHDAIISFNSRIFPRVLPRTGSAPVGIQVEGHVRARKGRQPAPMTKLELAIHRAARLSLGGLPVCDIRRIDPATATEALAACRGALIGHGRVRASSRFPGQEKSASFNGRVLLFNGRLEDGRPAILVHVFNSFPPSSFVVPFTVTHHRGLYGTILTADVRIDRWSSVTAFRLVLDRTFRQDGRRRGFLNAGCPAPHGFDVGISPFVQARLSFADGSRRDIAVVSSCKVGR